MSKYEDQSIVAFPRARMLTACRTAVERLGWCVLQQDDTGLLCVEGQQNLLSASPVQMEIRILGGEAGTDTRILFRGSNYGFGPIQSNYVKSQVRRLMEEVGKAAIEPPATRTSSATRPESATRSVIINRVRLSDEQIATIEQAYRVRIQNGEFWYDPMTGGWGYRGRPTAGFMQAGLTLGGPLASDASNGDTGVFINGRQLPLQDLLLLQQVVATPIWPGRYWLDAQGYCGFEGGPVMGNIWATAQQSGVPREGILSTYDKVGMIVIG